MQEMQGEFAANARKGQDGFAAPTEPGRRLQSGDGWLFETASLCEGVPPPSTLKECARY
jgi:hypothetical protein